MNKLQLKWYTWLYSTSIKIRDFVEKKREDYYTKVIEGNVSTKMLDRALYKPKPDNELSKEQFIARKQLQAHIGLKPSNVEKKFHKEFNPNDNTLTTIQMAGSGLPLPDEIKEALLNSKELEITERLEKSGSFNSMCSHRIRLTDEKNVDKELIGWLKAAYEEAK